jgi:hypothetical protein
LEALSQLGLSNINLAYGLPFNTVFRFSLHLQPGNESNSFFSQKMHNLKACFDTKIIIRQLLVGVGVESEIKKKKEKPSWVFHFRAN